jgi:hypothetical protein
VLRQLVAHAPWLAAGRLAAFVGQGVVVARGLAHRLHHAPRAEDHRLAMLGRRSD